MKSSHSPAATFAVFDDPNLLAHDGLAPAVRLAERCGLPGLGSSKFACDLGQLLASRTATLWPARPHPDGDGVRRPGLGGGCPSLA